MLRGVHFVRRNLRQMHLRNLFQSVLFSKLQDSAIELVRALGVDFRVFGTFVGWGSGLQVYFALHHPYFILSVVDWIRALRNGWFWNGLAVLVNWWTFLVEVCEFVNTWSFGIGLIQLSRIVICFYLTPCFTQRLPSLVPSFIKIIVSFERRLVSTRAPAHIFEVGWILLIKIDVVLQILRNARRCLIGPVDLTFFASSFWSLFRTHSTWQFRLNCRY